MGNAVVLLLTIAPLVILVRCDIFVSPKWKMKKKEQ